MKVVLVGCTPMAEKLYGLLEGMKCVQSVYMINLSPFVSKNKSNYCGMMDTHYGKICIHYTYDINSELTMNWIKELKPDLIVQAGWSQIFSKALLELPKLYCIGIHAAPLPKGRGAAILNWKLIEGGGQWGNSLFIMEKTTDTGAILDSEPFELEPRDDIRTAYLKADRTALRMIERTLPKIGDGTIKPKKQSKKETGRYYKRTPADGEMKFDWPAEKITNYVRALTHPYPGAFFSTRFGQLVVWSVERESIEVSFYEIGTIMEIKKGEGVLVQIESNVLIWLKSITPPNDVETWADTWAIEQGFKAGDNLLKGGENGTTKR